MRLLSRRFRPVRGGDAVLLKETYRRICAVHLETLVGVRILGGAQVVQDAREEQQLVVELTDGCFGHGQFPREHVAADGVVVDEFG